MALGLRMGAQLRFEPDFGPDGRKKGEETVG